MAIAAETMLARFKGCMLGSLIGDCLGAPFEMDGVVSPTLLNNYMKKLANPKTRVPYKKYTDDTAMTKGVAQSLIDKKAFDATDMAKKFVTEYFAASNRGYGANVVQVFAALKATKFKDAFAPSYMQFEGRGSYGNGGGMRICPISLFTANDSEQAAADMARDCALITHSNPLGYNGAILQCLAVREALLCPANSINPQQYLDKLIAAMTKLHNPHEEDQQACADGDGLGGYVDSLHIVQELLSRTDPVDTDIVVNKLGNDVRALYSIPTAIYAFLRALQPIPGIEDLSSFGPQKDESLLLCDNAFMRAIHYAISLGGDTDTIGSMAGAIAGAYHSSINVPEYLGRHCEDWKRALQQAQQLYDVVYTPAK